MKTGSQKNQLESSMQNDQNFIRIPRLQKAFGLTSRWVVHDELLRVIRQGKEILKTGLHLSVTQVLGAV